jgi:lysophospholipase L1-like esterase
MNKKIKIELATGIITLIAITVSGLIWLGNHKSQTGWQYAISFVGMGQPAADAASRTVFLGDSITALENWNTLLRSSDIKNAGVSGNTTDDVLARLSVAISAKPQKLFLMMGINDFLRGQSVDYVAANYELVINRIKSESPATLIYIQSTLPINSASSHYGKVDSQKIITLNEKLKVLAAEKKVFFIDLYPSFCGPDNQLYAKYAADGLHLNSHGYAVWKELITPYFQ